MTSEPQHVSVLVTELLLELKAIVTDCEHGALEAGDSDTKWLEPAKAVIAKAELASLTQQTSGETL
jgi:hypothetical protein